QRLHRLRNVKLKKLQHHGTTNKVMTMFKRLKNVLAMPGRFIEACQTLAEATDRNTEAVRAMHRDLLNTIKSVEKHTQYLATSEEHRLRREGRPHVFKN